MERYQFIQVLGEGAFGRVVEAVEKSNGSLVAIKQFKATFRTWKQCTELRELKSLRHLRHRHIVLLKEVIREKERLFFIFEHLPKTLHKLICHQKAANKDKAFDNTTVQRYMFFHRDIKPENILVSSDDILKIADFGLAREIRSLPPYTEYVSTRWYRAPELLLNSTSYSSPVDLWAAGCVMAELYTGVALFPGKSAIDQLTRIYSMIRSPAIQSALPDGGQQRGALQRPKRPEVVNHSRSLSDICTNASAEGIKLLSCLLDLDPSKRLTAAQAISHPFFDPVHIEASRLAAPEVNMSHTVKDVVPNERTSEPQINNRLSGDVDIQNLLQSSEIAELSTTKCVGQRVDQQDKLRASVQPRTTITRSLRIERADNELNAGFLISPFLSDDEEGADHGKFDEKCDESADSSSTLETTDKDNVQVISHNGARATDQQMIASDWRSKLEFVDCTAPTIACPERTIDREWMDDDWDKVAGGNADYESSAEKIPSVMAEVEGTQTQPLVMGLAEPSLLKLSPHPSRNPENGMVCGPAVECSRIRVETRPSDEGLDFQLDPQSSSQLANASSTLEPTSSLHQIDNSNESYLQLLIEKEKLLKRIKDNRWQLDLNDNTTSTNLPNVRSSLAIDLRGDVSKTNLKQLHFEFLKEKDTQHCQKKVSETGPATEWEGQRSASKSRKMRLLTENVSGITQLRSPAIALHGKYSQREDNALCIGSPWSSYTARTQNVCQTNGCELEKGTAPSNSFALSSPSALQKSQWKHSDQQTLKAYVAQAKAKGLRGKERWEYVSLGVKAMWTPKECQSMYHSIRDKRRCDVMSKITNEISACSPDTLSEC